MRPVNDGFRFLLEMSLLAALAYWGFHGRGGLTQWVLGLGAPLLLALIWGTIMAPKAKLQLTDPVRLAAEVVLFGAGVAALFAAGADGLAIAFAVCVAVHLALTFPLRQRSAP
jgi:Protein of unknown function (DUF2568)